MSKQTYIVEIESALETKLHPDFGGFLGNAADRVAANFSTGPIPKVTVLPLSRLETVRIFPEGVFVKTNLK